MQKLHLRPFGQTLSSSNFGLLFTLQQSFLFCPCLGYDHLIPANSNRLTDAPRVVRKWRKNGNDSNSKFCYSSFGKVYTLSLYHATISVMRHCRCGRVKEPISEWWKSKKATGCNTASFRSRKLIHFNSRTRSMRYGRYRTSLFDS